MTAHGSPAEHSLEVVGMSKVYPSRHGPTEAIAHLDFVIDDSEFVSVVGPSGCGKTTLLKCISGLMRPSGGKVLVAGHEITQPPRELAIVFQEYSRSLLPWMTVGKNVYLPLRRNKDKTEAREAVRHAIESVGLAGFEDHYPWQLSGGMQQRVAIARALAYRPRVLLLDEPFASVDAQTRADLEDLVLRLQGELGMTTLLVTHDIDESVYMSDRIVVLSPRPSSVVEVVDVDLPSPRDQIETKQLPEFGRLRAEVYRAIKADRRTVTAGGSEATLPEPVRGTVSSLPANQGGEV